MQCLAPSTPNRTAAEPARKPRCGRSNPLRDVQRARAIYIGSGRPLPIRIRKDNRACIGLWRWRVTCSSRFSRLCDTQQYSTDRCGWAGRHRALPAATTEEWSDIPHQRREGDSQEYQGGNRLRRTGPCKGGEGVVWSCKIRWQERRVHTTRRTEAQGKTWTLCNTQQELTRTRSALNDSGHQRFSSIPRSSAWSTLVCTRSWSRPYIGPTWICEKPSMATLCSREVPH